MSRSRSRWRCLEGDVDVSRSRRGECAIDGERGRQRMSGWSWWTKCCWAGACGALYSVVDVGVDTLAVAYARCIWLARPQRLAGLEKANAMRFGRPGIARRSRFLMAHPSTGRGFVFDWAAANCEGDGWAIDGHAAGNCMYVRAGTGEVPVDSTQSTVFTCSESIHGCSLILSTTISHVDNCMQSA